VLPVKYSDKFYSQLLSNARAVSKLALVEGLVVGAICCEQHKSESKESAMRMYVLTLAVLGPYRNSGIGTALVSAVMKVVDDSAMSGMELHVQVDNDDAIRLYRKLGFNSAGTFKNYYKRTVCNDAYLLSKDTRAR